MEKKELNVTGMDCDGCENAITNALTQLIGVEECVASYVSGKVAVSYDPDRVDLEEITGAISGAGYEVAG
jgi:copper chaperone